MKNIIICCVFIGLIFFLEWTTFKKKFIPAKKVEVMTVMQQVSPTASEPNVVHVQNISKYHVELIIIKGGKRSTDYVNSKVTKTFYYKDSENFILQGKVHYPNGGLFFKTSVEYFDGGSWSWIFNEKGVKRVEDVAI